ncbi:MAG: ATP-binding protein [Methanoregula sp.]|nr:ATP-binding protein [Methanoregula sp.]
MDQPFEMIIRSDSAEIPDVSARLESALHARGFSRDDILDTQLAVEEIITNIINHGYKNTGGEIFITCRINPSCAEIRIEDTAPRFDPLSVPEPELDGSIEDRKIGGLGIFLVRQVMDEIFYRYENGRNILVIIKRKKG